MRSSTLQPGKERKADMRADELDSGSSLTVADIVRMLLRHKWFIVACIMACTAVSLIYIKTATPIYEASGSIRIDPTRAGSLGLADLTGAAGAEDKVPTELAIIKTDAVAISTLNSLSSEEFKRYTGRPKETLAIPQSATSLTPQQEDLLGLFKSQVNAAQVPNTQLVAITCRNANPQIAALLVNHTISAYLKQSFDTRYGSITQVSHWLSDAMNSLRDKAADAQRKLADFQEQNNFLGTDSSSGSNGSGVGSGNTTMERLGLLNTRLASAQADRIVKEAQMRAAEGGNPAVLSALYPSSGLSTLQGEQARLHSQYAQLSTKFGLNYPPLAETRILMQNSDAAVNAEIGNIKSRLQEEYQAAKSVEGTLQGDYDAQTEKAFALNRQQATYAVLKAEGTSSRELYNTLQYKLEQAGVEAGLGGVDTTIVDTARAPRFPIEPKKSAILSFGLILGLFLGVGIALLREASSDKVQSAEQVERALRTHLLTAVPHLASGKVSQGDSKLGPSDLVALSSPLSRDAESFRTLRNSVLLSNLDAPAKTILITSTIPGEGKSYTAANYAIILAQNNSRVLLVDADLRRPTIHPRFGVSNDVGLSNLILGEDVPSPITNPLADLPNLFLLAAGKKVPLPSEALASGKFYALLQQWEKDFDFVIIDSAPLLIVSDSLPLASWVDALILITRFNLTPVSGLKRIRDILERTNANLAGVVLNDISNASAAYGGKYGYEYYK